MSIVLPENCMQCGVCVEICPQKALSFKKNNIGDIIGLEVSVQCTDCGLCMDRCPINYRHPMNGVVEYRTTRIAGMNSSSSGGVATAIVREFVKGGGYICVSVETANCMAKHILTNDLGEIDNSVGSKYVLSDTIGVFPKILTLLNADERVLYVSISCQVSALHSYLGKEYDNLYCVDLLCSANITQEVLAKYMSDVNCKKYIHRSGSSSSNPAIVCSDGTIASDLSRNGIAKQRLKRNLCMRGCLSCQHHSVERIGDMSVGDYWGRFKHHKSIRGGASLVLINNNRLLPFYNALTKDFEIVLTKDQAVTNNCIDFLLEEDVFDRNDFYHNEFQTKHLSNIRYKKYDIELSSCTTVPNYGSVILSWSIYKYLIREGYSVQLNESNVGLSGSFGGNPKVVFPEGYGGDIPIGVGNSEILLRAGDQQWNYAYNSGWYAEQLFRGRKEKKLAYGVSFGRVDGGFTGEARLKDYADDFRLFDGISVRETNDVKLLAGIGVGSSRVADCCFLLNKEDYENVMSENDIFGDYIVVYDLYSELVDTTMSLVNNRGLKVVYISNFGTELLHPVGKKICKECSVASFLRILHDATGVVTNSLHGIYFSMIFGVPFIPVLQRNNYDDTRFATLNSVYGISGYTSKDNLADMSKLQFDFSSIERITKKEKFLGGMWLKNRIEGCL